MEKLQEGSTLHQATESALKMLSDTGIAVVEDITTVIIDKGTPSTAQSLSESLCADEVMSILSSLFKCVMLWTV